MKKNIIKLVIGTVLFLLIPLALTIRDGNVKDVGWNWSLGDFVFAFVMIFGTGLAYLLISRKSAGITSYKVAVAIGLLAGFLLIWINAAVGIIGEGPINMLYPGMLLIGIIISFVSRLKPEGLSKAMFITAFLVALVPIIALLVGTADFTPSIVKVFILNSFFVILFIISGMFFRRSTTKLV